MSDSESSIIDGSSELQEGGVGMGDTYVYMLLCICCSTVCMTIIVLSCVINKKSNCK